jgi:hypothetical protein
MRAALFIMPATNSSLVFTFPLQTSLFIHPHRQKSKGVRANFKHIFTPIKIWTHVYMNLFTRNSPHYYLLKYLLFLLKHPVYTYIQTHTHTHTHIYIYMLLLVMEDPQHGSSALFCHM